MRSFVALITMLGDGGVYPDQGLPGYGRPDQGLPGQGYPDQGLPHPPGRPTHPIVIPPGAIGPGAPSHPIYLPVRPDNSLPPHAEHPIVFPPGFPNNDLPVTPGLPPLVPTHPIAGLPVAGQLPVMPPHLGGGPASPDMPEGSVLLVPVHALRPIPVPQGVNPNAQPYIAWGGHGTVPQLCWITPPAQPK